MKALSEKLRVAIIAAISLAITLITIILFSTTTNARSSQLDINHDQLLNQRIRLEKSLILLKGDLSSLQHKNVDLDRCIFDAKKQIANKESEIQEVLAGKTDSATLADKISELEVIRKNLSLQVNSLNLQLDNNLVQFNTQGGLYTFRK